MNDIPPGLNSQRLVILMEQSIKRCNLQLDSLIILTEAATGAYIVTPVLAAMAGAEKVFALTRSSRYGTAESVIKRTQQLAEIAGVSDRIEFRQEKTKTIVAQADIITNSGHVRPIDEQMIKWMKPTVVIGLMYEAWEFRSQDVDLNVCRQRGIQVAGVNERHPGVDVFSFLGIMAIKLLLDAGIAIYTSNILLLCDNPFSSFIQRGLINAGATVDTVESLTVASTDKIYDAVVVALQPRQEPVLSAQDIIAIAKYWPGCVVAQYWGDIDRSTFLSHNIPVYPEIEPKPGHMAILPSGVGPEPIIRLQTGGFKAAEVIWRQQFSELNQDSLEFVQLL
ncbi:hypothetical protein G7B40_029905 [Aetokthonos hydrillicola Thurmond2011]|jgi:hypothetical protein|uniref:Uncharacterized protein n=1 Tax=Aetokthonos hydrillicola Thurmond2011 TaxID=2712845 RepID=A0AAP5MC43_9CYAN|nr:hypothetical protein [Aetokthonos hydrillicola]MBO3463335.1 hypothetical protein [Aetokthonos hydrillicola CCALA 1050]MBW4589182.1 hypothetical protein [Aetokthonos hydrillicola CCALA 1050]MDR9898742.1 hypothetical protein [Aetokthonos hydrillicola Thurmond2011]